MPALIGSLFSGIGGLELGLERAGLGRVVWQAECDAWCRGVLAAHWPDARRFDDVRAVRAGDAERVDVICGGFPCQDISRAGKRVGMDGARSGLWSEYARIIGELSPSWVVIENVDELRRAGLDRVLGDLAALGFDAEWTTLRASDVGAPHERPRLFVVAHRCDDRCEGRTARDGAESALDVAVRRDADGCCLDVVRDRLREAVEPCLGGGSDGIPHRVDCGLPPDCDCDGSVFPAGRGLDPHEWEPRRVLHDRREYGEGKGYRIHALGNAVLPMCAESVGRAIAAACEGWA